MNEFIADQENKNTRAKTERDVKLLKAFLTVKGESRKPEELTPQEPTSFPGSFISRPGGREMKEPGNEVAQELNEYLSEFILNVKRKDGEDYEPSSLRGLIASFNRHFKEQKYPGSIIEGAEFEQTRKCLEARSKQLKKQGKGNKPNAAQALTDDEVNILFEQNLLGISSAEALSNTLWFFNTVHFGVRGCQEHRDMAWGDVKLEQEADGTEYLEYTERENLSMNKTNKLQHGKCFCTVFTHSFVCFHETHSLAARSFVS